MGSLLLDSSREVGKIYLTETQILLRIIFSALLGVIFGAERKHKNKPIGARTHALISLAACTIAIISAYGFTELATAYPDKIDVRSDPARLMVGMLTGIGFIGAGIIYKSPHGDIKGITTAAEVYLMAVLGIGAGLGLYFLTAVSAAVAYLALICSSARMTFIKRHCIYRPLYRLRNSIRGRAGKK